eukprot:4594851-Prymnesium_polylepis.3
MAQDEGTMSTMWFVVVSAVVLSAAGYAVVTAHRHIQRWQHERLASGGSPLLNSVRYVRQPSADAIPSPSRLPRPPRILLLGPVRTS